MGDVINLRRARKARDRQDRKAQADRNSTTHGMPKRLKSQLRAERDREDRIHEGHRTKDDSESQ